jgi:hypothetical protein
VWGLVIVAHVWWLIKKRTRGIQAMIVIGSVSAWVLRWKKGSRRKGENPHDRFRDSQVARVDQIE